MSRRETTAKELAPLSQQLRVACLRQRRATLHGRRVPRATAPLFESRPLLACTLQTTSHSHPLRQRRQPSRMRTPSQSTAPSWWLRQRRRPCERSVERFQTPTHLSPVSGPQNPPSLRNSDWWPRWFARALLRRRRLLRWAMAYSPSTRCRLLCSRSCDGDPILKTL